MFIAQVYVHIAGDHGEDATDIKTELAQIHENL